MLAITIFNFESGNVGGKLNIEIISQLKNYTVIRNADTNKVYLYSYKELIACYDGLYYCNRDKLTCNSKMHLKWFKQEIKELNDRQ